MLLTRLLSSSSRQLFSEPCVGKAGFPLHLNEQKMMIATAKELPVSVRLLLVCTDVLRQTCGREGIRLVYSLKTLDRPK